MPVSELSAVERIARVLAGQRLSANAKGEALHASNEVEARWPEHQDDAIAILRTLREPDTVMADAGNVDTWRAMVEAAISGFAGDPGEERQGHASGNGEMLQPPKLGDVTD